MLEIQNLTVDAGSIRLLQVDYLQIKSGEFCGIVGPNGAGKSTLLKCIAGDIDFNGEILLHGKPIQQWKRNDLARHMAVLPQSNSIEFAFKAIEIVELGLTPLSLSREQAQKLTFAIMQTLNCAHLANRFYPELSGGEQQRVNLARVLVQLAQAEHPPLLLLDEALSAQDLGQQHALLQTIQQYRIQSGAIIAGVIHDLNHVFRYCDTSALLRAGSCLSKSSAGDVLTADQIDACWGYSPEILVSQSGNTVIA